MKFFIVFALCVAAASARFIVPDVAAAEAAEIKEILAAINNPSTDPATAAALQQLLNDFLGIHVGPAIVDGSPIAPGPEIVDENEDPPIDIEPEIVDEFPNAPPEIVEEIEDLPIDIEPEIVDEFPNAPGPEIIEENEDLPIDIEPEIVDEYPNASGPEIVDENEDPPIDIEPEIVDEFPNAPPEIVEEIEDSPIHVGPVIIDDADLIDAGPAIDDQPNPSSSPLVQIIINVKPGAQAGPNPVEVIDASPVIMPEDSLTFPGPGFSRR